MKRRIISLLLVLCLAVAAIPFGTVNLNKTVMKSNAAASNYTFFQQSDPVWKDYDPSGAYAYGCSIGPQGCGLMSMVNAVYYLNGNMMDIKALADWAFSISAYGGGPSGSFTGSDRSVLYPRVTAQFGAKYGFAAVGSGVWSNASNASLKNHLANGGVAVAHVQNHFICLAGYDATTDRILVLDSAADFQNRFTSEGGNWLSYKELSSDSSKMIVDWFQLFSNAASSITNYNVTSQISSGLGSVIFGSDLTARKAPAGDNVFFRVVPDSGYKVSSITVNGTAIAVQNSGGPASYSFTMPSADAVVKVNFASGGTTYANSVIIGGLTYDVNAGIVMRTDASKANTYVGMFAENETSYTIANSLFYYYTHKNWAYGTDTAGTLVGKTIHMQSAMRGGKVANYAAGNFKLVMFNPNGTQVSGSNIVSFTLTGTSSHYESIAYIPGGTSTGGGNITSITPHDIIFDNQTAVNWANSSGGADTTVALQSGSDTYMSIVTSAASNDPQLNLNFSTLESMSASTYKYMVITARTSNTANKNAKMYLCPGTITAPTEDCAITWSWTADGAWHDYLIDLSGISTWTGNLNMIRFDYFDGTTSSGAELDLRSIKFYTSKPSVATITTNKASYTTGETVTLNYSGLGSYLETNQNQTPFIAIYPSTSYPGKTSALMYKYVTTASGSFVFPTQAAGGTSVGNLPAGSYTAWLAYDADGTKGSNNINNIMYAGSSASYAFTVSDSTSSPTTYAVTTKVAAGSGTVQLSNGSTSGNYEAGKYVSYTVTPASGYKVSKIVIYGTSQTILNNGAAATYSFPMEAVAATISVTFEAINVDTSVIDKIGTSTASGANSAVIKVDTSVSDTIAALQTQLGTSVTITKDGAEVSSSTAIGTGMVVTAGSVTYTVVVAGDVDGDGAVTVADAANAMSGLRGTTTLSNASKDAAKEISKKSGTLSILDIMAILNAI